MGSRIRHDSHQLARTLGALAAAALLFVVAGAPVPAMRAQDATPSTGAATPAGRAGPGLSRRSPAAPSEEVISGAYGATLLEAVQGEDAAELVEDADPNNPAPPAGQEYVAARVRVRNVGNSQEPIPVTPTSFGLTGTAARLHAAAPEVAPDPELRGDLSPNGVIEGWVVLPAIAGETNRMLVLLPGAGVDPETFRYIAVDVGASLPPGGTPVADPAVGAPAAQPGTPPNDLGTAQDAPAGAGEVVVSDQFALQIIEFVRGDQASEQLRAASRFNPNPRPGNEHALLKVRATYLGPTEGPISISPLDFGMIGGANVRYAASGLVTPEPGLDARLYPGGTIEGYLAFEVQRNDPNLSLVYQPVGDPEAAPRYLAAVPDGGTSTPAP